MNSQWKYIFAILITMFLILSGCDSNQENKEERASRQGEEAVVTDDGEAGNNIILDKSTTKNDQEADIEIATEKDTSTRDLQIDSKEDAIRILREKLVLDREEDYSFGVDDTLYRDEKGSYYIIQVVDIRLREAGKTGNLGYYQVYLDGTYQPFQVAANVSESEKGLKDSYLDQLQNIERKIEAIRTESEATTTVEIEKEERKIYEIWDTALNDIYKVLQDQLAEEEMNHLREEQREWITYRDDTAEEVSRKYEGGTMESIQYVNTQAFLTKKRCYELVEKYMN